MAKEVLQTTSTPFVRQDYERALVASGLVDDVTDIASLDASPYRYMEAEYICRHGDDAECLWVIVTGSVAVREDTRTLFIRHRNEVIGEQNLLGNGYRRMYNLVASESNVELLKISKSTIQNHPEKQLIWRNIAKIISLKLKSASTKVASLERQLEDDTRILQDYTNEYALSRRLQSGRGQLTDYKVERAVVWFSDVVNFSQHIINLAPERTADIVQRFFNAQSVPITAHGGHIDKFMGDGLMAFWVLRESEKPGYECVETLRAAEEAVNAVSKIRIGSASLNLRIGLHVGLVLSGDFGSTTRHQFTLIGPEVNKAARLEAANGEDLIEGESEIGKIRMSVEFHEELSELFKKKYNRESLVRAKNIGDVTIYS
jgi:class 3 adenylate cyclase